MERDQMIQDLKRNLKAKEHYVPPPPSQLPPTVVELIDGMSESLRCKIETIKGLEERIKALEEENAEYKRKQAYVEPSDDESDDIASEDTATELTEANHALMQAQDENTALSNEVERLVNILAQREEEIMALEEENEEILNEGPYERAERLNVLSKIVTEITPEPTIDILNDHTCLICLNNTDGPFIRTNKCNIDHGVCFSCFATLMNSPGKAQCPICMTKWEEGNLLIE
ncbi:Serine/threonine protein kinase [Giardia duodenalis]|uniref:RING-type domain-containing protein n=2 Tax=Giardia intestinalis TaxID=5741 RepID=C6LTE1_GIAIB|nr:Hypothetical protein GL50581_2038 [Giardia intestinalis ATCC 50581]ESU40851.1 Serine/threonine protein kinase [Giardia intestinalis]